LKEIDAAKPKKDVVADKIPDPTKEKNQPFSQDGWLFPFVPITAETVSVLKDAG